VHSLLQDLRHGVRLLGKTPGFSATAVAALALGIGATTAIFSVVDAVLLKPLPFRDPDRLLAVWEKKLGQKQQKMFVASGNFLEWGRQSRTLEALAAIQETHVNLTGGPNGHIDPQELKAERVTAGLFPLLGVRPVVGRTFLPEEDRPGGAPSALLSYELWQRRFGGDPAIAGKAVMLGGQSCNVTGVLPPGFAVVEPGVEVWTPLALSPGDARGARRRILTVVARLKHGVEIGQARAELETLGATLERADPDLNQGWRPSVFTLNEAVRGQVRQPLLILAGAVSLLLLIACANVANLLLARGTARRKELAVRAAMGASRGRIAGQLLTESCILSLAGGAAGLVLARGAVSLAAWLGPQSIPHLGEARFDARLFLFALAASLATGMLFGMAPALQASGANLNAVLVEAGRSGTSGRTGSLVRNGLVVAEVALAVLVLIGSGLLMRSFVNLRLADLGFQKSGLLTFRMRLAGGRNTSAERRAPFLKDLLEQLRNLPGVRVAGLTSGLPLNGLGSGIAFAVEGRQAPPGETKTTGLLRSVSPEYFRAAGIPLIAGREFSDADDTSQARLALIVNQTLARRFWTDGASPLSRRLVLDFTEGTKTGEIVGVVGDVKPDRVEAADWPTVYCTYAQQPIAAVAVALRTAGPPMALAAPVERAVHQLDPDQAVADLRTMDDVVDQSIAGQRFDTVLLGIFATIAFALCAVGIYGVISYDVGQRTNEIGIRLALGAGRSGILRLVVGEAAGLAALGIGLGLAAAFALTRLMAGMLYGVRTNDAYTFAGMALLLGMVALAAGYVPARRAMAVDPLTALRHE
jgi:putative ABC transport system permease protein